MRGLIACNLDLLLLFHVGEKVVGVLVETTKRQQPSKQKVDQVAARTKEYIPSTYLAELLGGNPNIYPLLLVTSNGKPEINKEAKLDSVTNEVAIFTSKQKIEELVNLLKKEERLNHRKVIDMLCKSISRPKETTKNIPLFHWRYIQRIVMSRAAIFFCVLIVCEIVLPVGNGRSKG